MSFFERVNVLGINIDATNIEEVIKRVDNKIIDNSKGYVTVTGVHGIMESQRSQKVKEAHNKAWQSVPDGMPLVYIGKMFGHKKMWRCYGPAMMHDLLKHSISKGYTHFLYGGKEGVAKKLKENLEEKFPGIKIVGTYTPPFRALNQEEKIYLVNRIDQLSPNFIWVGLSTPKQELFMSEYIDLLNTNLMFGVGAAFDFHTGTITSAPKWMQVLALEWLYRLIQEPKRLWKRYLINNPLFLFNIILQLLKKKI